MTTTASTATPPPAHPGRTVAAGDFTLYVRRSGDPSAAPAVLVHGLGGSATNWTDLQHELGDEVDAHAIDLPGHGRTPPPPSRRYDVASHADAVIAYISELDRGPVHLLGNSMGGAVSTVVAARRPDLVRTLTLVSPALPTLIPRGADQLRLGLMLLPGVREALAGRIARTTPEARAKAVLELCFADPTRIHPQRLAEAQTEGRRRASLPWAMTAFAASASGLLRGYLAVGPRSAWVGVAQVRAPVLLIWGRRDVLVSEAVIRRAARTFADCRLEVFDDTGHVSQMERPVEVAALVREHLAVHDGPNREQAAG